jgi:adenosylhomocysteine nucleosidase
VHNNAHAPLVIIVAMDSELRHLHDLLPGWQDATEGESVWPTQRTTHRSVPVIVIRCGIGMVAAAAATEHAIHRYAPRWIMNFGCAGAHTREILPGDVIIGTRLVSHGRMRVSATEGIVPMHVPFTVAGEPEPRAELRADPGLVTLAKDVAVDLPLDAWPEEFRLPVHSKDGTVTVYSGVVASADMWLQDPAWLDASHQRTGSLCEDMEAAAIAQVATLHGVPFLTIKDISNNEFHVASAFEGTESELPLSEVGKRAAVLTVATINRLLDQGNYS